MIVALDVGYAQADGDTVGLCGIVGFEQWDSSQPLVEESVRVVDVAPYVPGRFFERELPCLLAGMSKLAERDLLVEVVIVDGHVRLNQDGAPGLGAYLFDELGGSIPVVGVAKKPFRGLVAIEVLRGTSLKPLYVTAVGIDEEAAANHVRSMAGLHRLPMMLRAADGLTRWPSVRIERPSPRSTE